jgi:hypothetical protein
LDEWIVSATTWHPQHLATIVLWTLAHQANVLDENLRLKASSENHFVTKRTQVEEKI